MKAYKTFAEWWVSTDNPAYNMPESTKEQMKWHMRQAWNAGKASRQRLFETTEIDMI